MTAQPVLLAPAAGMDRDGTRLTSDGCIDGQWVRWQEGRPRKMGGMRAFSSQSTNICRGFDIFSRSGNTYLHIGSSGNLELIILDAAGNPGPTIDRSPVALVGSPNNIWSTDIIFDAITTKGYLLAQVAANLNAIDGGNSGPTYYGEVATSTAPLVDTTAPPVSGGVVVLHPFVFVYGDYGYVAWCVPGNPTDWINTGSGDANICEQKIVKGMILRGGPGYSPAGLFWSLNSLIRASFVGGTTIWSFDTVSDTITIMSSNAIVEYDGVFYWAGTDRFLVYNGVVREIPNQQNINWFFDGINLAQRQKVFAFRNTRWGEIWWCYPRGTATECTHAVIYNLREGKWYDTPLPDSGRSAATSPEVYPYPVMFGVDPDLVTAKYNVWQHEYGKDKIIGGRAQPILSYFVTNDISAVLQPQNAKNTSIRCVWMEPDLVQNGDMTVQIIGNFNARAPASADDIKTLIDPDNISQPSDQVLTFKTDRRQMRFIFTSNVINGDYWMGKTVIHIDEGTGNITG